MIAEKNLNNHTSLLDYINKYTNNNGFKKKDRLIITSIPKKKKKKKKGNQWPFDFLIMWLKNQRPRLKRSEFNGD